MVVLDKSVYPRAYGGTPSVTSIVSVALGLSPRVRGNLGHRWSEFKGVRSIPARTGEPRPTWTWRRSTKVYPRAYGGTSAMKECTTA